MENIVDIDKEAREREEIEQKRTLVVLAQQIIRITSLENLLVSKGLLSVEEIKSSHEEGAEKFNAEMKKHLPLEEKK